MRRPPPTSVTEVLSNVRDSLPQTLANLEIVLDMLKRYNEGVEQLLVILPQASSIIQTILRPESRLRDSRLQPWHQPTAPVSDRFPACIAVALTRRHQPCTAAAGTYCKIPKDAPLAVRGARNLPCVDVPGKRAATPAECRSDEPYVPLGTNPWYGDPNQILSCPAPGARCDQAVDPGRVIPAPSINSGMNPAPANLLPPPLGPTSDPLSPPGAGTVTCSGQQPNPCNYTPSGMATYNPQSGRIVGPDGVSWSWTDSRNIGDDGWKDMLAPAS